MDGKKRALLILFYLLYLHVCGYGQDCNIISKANDIIPDKLCAPVSVDWTVTYRGVNNAGTPVEFQFDWDDGNPVEVLEANDMGDGVWSLTHKHEYPVGGIKCNYSPTVYLVVNGVLCSSSDQVQKVTVWDTDEYNGGEMNIDPLVFPVCIGNDGTVTFVDNSRWNCTPPYENDAPNDRKRWVQWIYGTGGTNINTALVGGVAEAYPLEGDIEEIPEPVYGPVPPANTSKPVYIPDNYEVGDFFEVTLRNWNYCNPYDDPDIPGTPKDPVNGDNDPVITTAIALIVDVPDGTVHAAGPFCANEAPVALSAVSPGGVWSGPGIVDAGTGVFDPAVAGPGLHTIDYYVEDANLCSASGQVVIEVRESPVADIVSGSPAFLCPGTQLDLDGNPSLGVIPYTHLWTGDVSPLNDVNVQTPEFLTTTEGSYQLVYRVTDNNNCFDEDTLVIVVDSVDISFVNSNIELCSGENQTLQPGPVGGSGIFVQHRWSGDRVDLLSDANVENPVFSAIEVGVFKFEYYVRDSQGCEDKDSITVVVNQNPTANAGADAKTCGLSFHMQAVPSLGDASWQLVSGSGAVAFVDVHDPKTMVTVDAYGDYTFSWTEDNKGCSDVDEVVVSFVQVPSPVVMNDADTCGLNHRLEVSPDIGVGSWKLVSGPGGAVFDDDMAAVTNVSVDASGQYKFAWVEVNDVCEGRDTVSVDFYPDVVAALEPFDTEGCSPYSIDFVNISENVDSYLWDFGDGFGSNNANPLHAYSNPLQTPVDYKLKLQVYNNYGCRDSLEYMVKVNPSSISKFSNDPRPGCSPLGVDFTNESVGAVSYEWSFGDGSESETVRDVSHTFINDEDFVKSYEVKLMVNNEYGCPDTSGAYITVYPLIEYGFTASPVEGCHPLKVDLVAEPGAYLYNWDFGDGNTFSGSVNTSHVYNNTTGAGVDYKINLFTSSVFGCKDTAQMVVTVNPSPVSRFSIAPAEGCSPLLVDFTNKSTGVLNSYWDFGDGEINDIAGVGTVSHIYENDDLSIKNFTAKLTVENTYGCKDSTSSSVKVFPVVRAAISDGGLGCSPYSETLLNYSEGANKFYWDYGDGNTSVSYSGQNVFENTSLSDKQFKVSMVAESSYGCLDTATTSVLVYKTPSPSFTVTPESQQMPNSTITIDNTTQHSGWDYSWLWGNGDGSEGRHPGNYTYGLSGEYEVKLIVSSEHCTDSTVRSVEIIPNLPVLDYGPGAAGCPPLEVEFYNRTVDAHTFLWDFGDGNISAEREPVHTYYTSGTYKVKLTAEGPGGVMESDAVEVKVYEVPVADFEIRPVVVKLPQTVSFINKSEGAVSYLWNLGDGNTSVEHSLQYLYQEPGVYDVSLQVENDLGCTNERIVRNAVTAEEAGLIRFPNAFTPNPNGSNGGQYKQGDPDNFVFYPFVTEGIVEYDLKVFSRWGELIFESKDVAIGWDGYYKGKICASGVYIWKVVCKYSNGTIETKTGDVTLFR